MEVMRLKTNDLDKKNTENWEAVFDIVKGNEAKYFSIKTDPATNEGILMLDKVPLKQRHISVVFRPLHLTELELDVLVLVF